MIRTYLTSASLFAMALLLVPGCGKKNEETQNPDGAGDGVAADGTTDDQGGTAEKTPSKARGSTATRGGGRNTAARAKSMTTAKPPRKASEPKTVHGLAVEGWSLESAEALPDFASLGAPTAKTTVEMVNVRDQEAAQGFPGLGLSSNFAARLSGSINITTEAEYELCLNSDDGSRLLLEGTLVVDNDGVKDGAAEACAPVYLSPGEYLLEIHYFQAAGDRMALQFAWSQDNGDKQLVPTEVLFKPAA